MQLINFLLDFLYCLEAGGTLWAGLLCNRCCLYWVALCHYDLDVFLPWCTSSRQPGDRPLLICFAHRGDWSWNLNFFNWFGCCVLPILNTELLLYIVNPARTTQIDLCSHSCGRHFPHYFFIFAKLVGFSLFRNLKVCLRLNFTFHLLAHILNVHKLVDKAINVFFLVDVRCSVVLQTNDRLVLLAQFNGLYQPFHQWFLWMLLIFFRYFGVLQLLPLVIFARCLVSIASLDLHPHEELSTLRQLFHTSR